MERKAARDAGGTYGCQYRRGIVENSYKLHINNQTGTGSQSQGRASARLPRLSIIYEFSAERRRAP
jgi:hypothetical protein